MPDQLRTRRPAPSTPDSDTDPLLELGRVIADQARIQREWAAMRTEHETYTATVVHLHKQVAELSTEVRELRDEVRSLLDAQRVALRMVKQLRALAPLAVGFVELARMWLAHAGVLK